MLNKNKIFSKIFFIVYSVLFVIFALTLFFGGQKFGGAIYAIYVATEIAFMFLAKKYRSAFESFYRFSIYDQSLFNIVAVSTFVYYNVHRPYMIASLVLISIGFIVDLLSKNRFDKGRVESKFISLFEIVMSVAFIPCFFFEDPSLLTPVFALVSAIVVLVFKSVLALDKSNRNIEEEIADNNDDLHVKLTENINEDKNIE